MKEKTCFAAKSRGLAPLLASLLLAAAAMLAACVEEKREIDLATVEQRLKPATVTGPTIAEITASALSFKDKTITVSGKVERGLPFEFVGEQPYALVQGDAQLWVITTAVAPRAGSFVTVRGTLRAPYQIKGRFYEWALLEEERY